MLWPPGAAVPGFFVENRSYLFKVSLNGCQIPPDIQLLFNDVPSYPFFQNGDQYFPLEIGFYAGVLQATFVHGRKVIFSINIDVNPEISKITRDEYAAMISEISRSTLALYRLGGLTVPAEVEASARRSDVVTLELIKSNFDIFERAVQRIAEYPTRRLDPTSSRVDILAVRRIDDRAIAGALRSGATRPASAAEALAAPRLVGALGGRWIPRVDERRSQERTDVYENRALLGFMKWLERLLSSINHRISDERSMISPLGAVVWTDRLNDWRRRLSSLGLRDVFRGLRPDPALQATTVFRMHPDYASAFSSMIRMKAGLGTGAAATPSVPLDRTFALYEMWCYVGLLLGSAQLFPLCRPAIGTLLKGLAAPNDLGTSLAQGDSSRIQLESDITLTYQRRFSPTVDRGGSHTLLIEAVPDVTIERVDQNGRCIGLVVFDPKYRRGGSLLDGIRDLHVYRDAILGDKGARTVIAASALAPCHLGKVDPILSAAVDRPTVSVARPGHDPNVFANLIKEAVRTLKPVYR